MTCPATTVVALDMGTTTTTASTYQTAGPTAYSGASEAVKRSVTCCTCLGINSLGQVCQFYCRALRNTTTDTEI